MMTVLDNIMAGRKLHTRANFLEVAFQLPRARREETRNREAVEEIIEFLEIEHIRETPAVRLPYWLQKRVELGRAFAAEPRVLLLDEPMAGMNIEEKQDMCRFILDVNDHYGTTIVLIEHDMGVVMDTGKEVAARSIHALSDRDDKPFVPVNCAAIPPDVIESELFGHVKGAFSGAQAGRGGTVATDRLARFWTWADVQEVSRSRFSPRETHATDGSHPAMAVNLDACIHCNLCVRACREVQDNDVIGMAWRGHGSKVVFDFDDPMGASTCVACGECVQACPKQRRPLHPPVPRLLRRRAGGRHSVRAPSPRRSTNAWNRTW